MKKCFKCGEEKELAAFYKHPQTADGLLGKCKQCSRKDVKENRELRAEYYKAYDAARFQNDPNVAIRHRRYQKTDAGRDSVGASREKWVLGNQEKRAAHVILGNAVRDGRVKKPVTCSMCQIETPSRKLHAHHHVYTRPIDVTWLCAKCHVKEHKT